MKSDSSVRLQKVMAERGVASRRQCEVMIEEERVSVNGQVARLGSKVDPLRDEIRLDGKRLSAPRQASETVVLAMHKPPGVLCSNSDPHHPRTIFALVPPPYDRLRLFCAGRLDKESEGLLILTNDGALAQRLTHPSHAVVKRYRVTLDKPFQDKHIRTMLEGITWEGERLKVERVIPEKAAGPALKLELHLQHGKKREIRRLLLALGYGVTRLQRFQIGRLPLRGLTRGRCRRLTPEEVERLFG
jgi:23S rRNA pseudouridine2605 synthase